MNLRAVASALGGEVSGGQVLAPGPGHSPRDRSLAVKFSPDAPDGFVVYSHAGDDPLRCKDYVRAKIGAEPFRGNGIEPRRCPQTTPADTNDKASVDAIYDYHNENCELLFQVVRFKPKTFRQRRPNGNGGHVWNMDGARRVLYRLPEITEAIANGHPIFIAEGEKDVDALVHLGVTATCNPGGAGKWRDDYAPHFKGADVIVLPDNDDVGEKHGQDVVRSLTGIAASLRVLRLPGLPEKGDAFDWIEAGGTADDLWQLAQASAPSVVSSAPSGLIMRCAADIEPEPIDWIWQDRLARGKHTAIAGEPGLGKSQLEIAIIAAVTTGGAWPNGEGRAPKGRAIILAAEDGAADTLVPRLMAAGADLGMVNIIDAVRKDDGKGRRTFDLQTDLELLEARARELGDVILLSIDPISAYFGKGVDSHKNVDVRSVLEPVGEMATRLRAAILSVTHFSKGGSAANTKALHKFMGSIAFVAAPRVAFAIIEDPDDPARRLFLHAKNNLAPPPPGLAFRIEQTLLGHTGITASRIAWEAGAVTITADEAVAASKSKESKPNLEEAKQFLISIVGLDGTDVKEIKAEAEAAGLSWATVRRAKEELRLKSVKAGLAQGWLWKW